MYCLLCTTIASIVFWPILPSVVVSKCLIEVILCSLALKFLWTLKILWFLSSVYRLESNENHPEAGIYPKTSTVTPEWNFLLLKKLMWYKKIHSATANGKQRITLGTEIAKLGNRSNAKSKSPSEEDCEQIISMKWIKPVYRVVIRKNLSTTCLLSFLSTLSIETGSIWTSHSEWSVSIFLSACVCACLLVCVLYRSHSIYTDWTKWKLKNINIETRKKHIPRKVCEWYNGLRPPQNAFKRCTFDWK